MDAGVIAVGKMEDSESRTNKDSFVMFRSTRLVDSSLGHGQEVIIVVSVGLCLLAQGALGLQILGPLVEFFLGTPGHVQQELFAREVGPFLAASLGLRMAVPHGNGNGHGHGVLLPVAVFQRHAVGMLFVLAMVLVVVVRIRIVPSQFNRETIVAEGMIAKDHRIGSDFGKGSESNRLSGGRHIQGRRRRQGTGRCRTECRTAHGGSGCHGR